RGRAPDELPGRRIDGVEPGLAVGPAAVGDWHVEPPAVVGHAPLDAPGGAADAELGGPAGLAGDRIEAVGDARLLAGQHHVAADDRRGAEVDVGANGPQRAVDPPPVAETGGEEVVVLG